MKNSVVALVMYFINLVLQFYSRKIFLNYLGTEILGLNSTATNLLQFLNLAELGVWSAIATSLYKPLNDNDIDSINRIVTFNGLIYKRIALIIICGAAILMLFFPWIFDKMKLPLWYAYLSFGVLLFSSLLGYFVNYKQIILTANQQNYKVIYTYKLSMALKVLAQIVAMKFLAHPYMWWLILEFTFTIIGASSLSYIIKRTAPFLKKTKHTFKQLRKMYPEIIRNIKLLFVQKVSSFVLFQTSPLIIYWLASLSLVALYDNYMLMVNGLISLMAAIFNGMLAGIGNLVVSSDKKHVLDVFHELYTIRFYCIAVLAYALWAVGQPFVKLWIGAEYILPDSTLMILCIIFLVYVNRYVTADFLTVHGYFGDIWASVSEVVLNIGCSILLGLKWGLNGVLMGQLVTLVAISLLWKPFYLFYIKLKTGFSDFWKTTCKLTVLAGISCYIIILSQRVFDIERDQITFLIGAAQTVFFAVLLGVLLICFSRPFKNALNRIRVRL